MPEMRVYTCVCVCVLAAQFINLSSLEKFKETSTKQRRREGGGIGKHKDYRFFRVLFHIQRSQKRCTRYACVYYMCMCVCVSVSSLYWSRFAFVWHRRRFDLVASHFAVAKSWHALAKDRMFFLDFVARTFSSQLLFLCPMRASQVNYNK